MSAIRVCGLQPLAGEIRVQGSKNAVLPMMAAALLHKGTTVIRNVPAIRDVFCMISTLETLGCRCSFCGGCVTIDAGALNSAWIIPDEQVKQMRSSVILLGPLLCRTGEVRMNYPGGCSIGKRPIDLHLYALRCLGADIREQDEGISAAAGRLIGAEIHFPFPSVGATENAILTAVCAEGRTRIRNGAREPEILELCTFLRAMGADIKGESSGDICIDGGREFHDTEYEVCGDRIVAGTYLAAVMAATGEARLAGVNPDWMKEVLLHCMKCGADITAHDDGISIVQRGRPIGAELITGPYPEFPTDLQSAMMAVASVSCGAGRIVENVFERRFETAKELRKLDADIIIEGNTALVDGRYPLRGGEVFAPDLRGGAALVVAGLAAEGVTVIGGCGHIERGYEDICRDLSGLGAKITSDDE